MTHVRPQWIYTKQRLPRRRKCVLFNAPEYGRNNRRLVVYGYYEDGEWYDQGLDYTSDEKKRVGWPVLKWMPLPRA